MRVSEIRVKRIRVNQGLGVFLKKYFLAVLPRYIQKVALGFGLGGQQSTEFLFL